jgi:uracil-DNA glycosylase
MRQAAQQLEALRLAGLEWLPHGPPLVLSARTAKPASQGSPAPLPGQQAAPSLFGGAEEMPAADAQRKQPTLEHRRKELELLANKVTGCTRCPELAATRTQTVFADGQIPVEVCFIGEAPGADEDKQGKPFVGAAGQLLNKIIAACGMKREEVYICNIIKCRPPNNRTPKPEEAANCREYLTPQLELVQPKVICALGGCAAQNLLETTQPLGKLRGRFHDYRGIPVLCTYHPAYLLPHRSPGKKREVWEDMRMMMERLGRPVAAARGEGQSFATP